MEITNLTNDQTRFILREVDRDDIVIYLMDAPTEVYEKFTTNMTDRAKASIDWAIEYHRTLGIPEEDKNRAKTHINNIAEFLLFDESSHEELFDNTDSINRDPKTVCNTVEQLYRENIWGDRIIRLVYFTWDRLPDIEGFDPKVLKMFIDCYGKKYQQGLYNLFSPYAKKKLRYLFDKDFDKETIEYSEHFELENKLEYFLYAYLLLQQDLEPYFFIPYEKLNKAQKIAILKRMKASEKEMVKLEHTTFKKGPLLPWYKKAAKWISKRYRKLKGDLFNYRKEKALRYLEENAYDFRYEVYATPDEEDYYSSTIPNFPYLEAYRKRILVLKLVNLCTLSRRDGHEKAYDYIKDQEQWQPLLDMVRLISFQNPNLVQERVEEERKKHIEELETKLEFMIKGFACILGYKGETNNGDCLHQFGINPDASLEPINKVYLEEYSMDDIRHQLSLYSGTFMSEEGAGGILAAEKHVYNETNDLFKRVTGNIVDGYPWDDVLEYFELEKNALIKNANEKFDILSIGMRSICRGDNPRTAEQIMLTLIEPGERRSQYE